MPHNRAVALEFSAAVKRIPIYPAAASYGSDGETAMLASNESPYPPLPEVVAAPTTTAKPSGRANRTAKPEPEPKPEPVETPAPTTPAPVAPLRTAATPSGPEAARQIRDALERANRFFTWHEFNSAHAFMRDEGERYNPEVAHRCFDLVFDLFRRCL